MTGYFVNVKSYPITHKPDRAARVKKYLLEEGKTFNGITYERVIESFAHSPVTVTSLLWKTLSRFTEEALSHQNIQKLVKSDEKFDLVITETFMANEVFLFFGHKFSAPTITFYSMGSFSVINRVTGNSLALSYIPNYVFPFSDQMSLYERFISTYSSVHTLHSYYNEHIPRQQSILDRCINEANVPPLSDMIKNISLVFLNSHPATSYSQPLTPNLVQLGGIHISEKRQPLPKVIQKFMDEAKDGVIFFSLGTFVPDHHLPPEYFNNFINVFKRLKQKILWRTRLESIPGLPDNVMIMKWAPQQEILTHPNCVLFLSHGGLLSVLEVVYAGVPVVGIPFFSDQALNVRFLEERGVGIKLDFLTLSEETISHALNKVLQDPKYRKNAAELSRIFKDTPTSPADSAVFWVEYVLRHKGAHHLRPASALMPWYQLCLLDTLLALLATSVVIITATYWSCSQILHWRGRSKVVNCERTNNTDSLRKKHN